MRALTDLILIAVKDHYAWKPFVFQNRVDLFSFESLVDGVDTEIIGLAKN